MSWDRVQARINEKASSENSFRDLSQGLDEIYNEDLDLELGQLKPKKSM